MGEGTIHSIITLSQRAYTQGRISMRYVLRTMVSVVTDCFQFSAYSNHRCRNVGPVSEVVFNFQATLCSVLNLLCWPFFSLPWGIQLSSGRTDQSRPVQMLSIVSNILIPVSVLVLCIVYSNFCKLGFPKLKQNTRLHS